MKLKHLLFSGVFTALVAFGLLTIALPQNVRAVQPETTITCYTCPTWPPTTPTAVAWPETRIAAKQLCDTDAVYCILDGSNNKIGHQLVCVGCR